MKKIKIHAHTRITDHTNAVKEGKMQASQGARRRSLGSSYPKTFNSYSF